MTSPKPHQYGIYEYDLNRVRDSMTGRFMSFEDAVGYGPDE